MLRSQAEKTLANAIAIGSFLTTIAVVGWNANEPVNAPKLVFLGATAFACLPLLIGSHKGINFPRQRKFLFVTSTLFIFFALISLFMSESSIPQGFFGIYGRNTGFLAYLCLVIIFWSTSLIQMAPNTKIVLSSIYYAGIVNIVYFILTQIGIQLINWNNPNKLVLGTFGNTNFVGAFMGIFVVICSISFFSNESKLKKKLFLGALILVALYEVKLSHAVQGIVVTLLGWTVAVFFYIRSKFLSRIFLMGYSVVVTLLGFVAAAGALQIGPLTKLIYKTSVSLRGEYWYAGWHMGITHPVFGVGMDSYGIWYRRMRAPSALILPGPDITSNAAHNVFMDLFASGGFPLLISYIILNFFVAFNIWRGFKVIKSFDPIFVTLVAGWICYEAQSVISINQIGIAIWGWVFGGLLIGYVQGCFQSGTKDEKSSIFVKQSKGRVSTPKRKELSVLILIAGGLLGAAIASPPYISDSKWYSSLKKMDPTRLEPNSKGWPLEPMRLLQASDLYTQHNVPSRGLEIALYATREFPNSFEAWKIYFGTPGISNAEKVRVKAELHRLDPLNPAFK